jgi:hypothetical protein
MRMWGDTAVIRARLWESGTNDGRFITWGSAMYISEMAIIVRTPGKTHPVLSAGS